MKPEGLIPLLTSSDPVLSQTAWWIAGRHPEWGGALARFLKRGWQLETSRGTERDTLAQKLALFASAPAIQALLGGVRLRKARLARA